MNSLVTKNKNDPCIIFIIDCILYVKGRREEKNQKRGGWMWRRMLWDIELKVYIEN